VGGACGAVGDDGNAGILGDFVEEDVAANPPSAASGWFERRSTLDCRKREGEMRNQNDGAYGPGGQVVMQDIEIWRAVGEDSALHL
jgi:hypothetical protein